MAGVLGAVAVVRYLVLADRHAPATIDAGNWLAFGNAVLGDSIRHPDIVYPPLVPLLVRGATDLIGPVAGVALLGALCSVLPAAGAYLALRLAPVGGVQVRWCLVALCSLLALSASTGEATAWGGFPQLIGTGLTPLLLVTVDRSLRRGWWSSTIAASALVAVLLAASHFAFTYAAAGAGAMAGLVLATVPAGRRLDWLRSRAAHLAVIALPVLVAVPFYLPLISAMGENRLTDLEATLTWGNAFRWLEFTYRDVPLLWRTLIVASLLVPIALRRAWRTVGWRLTVSALVAVVAGSVLSREARFLYFLPLVCVLAVALWLAEVVESPDEAPAIADDPFAPAPAVAGPGRWRSPATAPLARWALAVLVALAAVQAVTGLRYFRDQRDFYGILTPDTFAALEWLRSETPPDTVVGVSTVDDAPVGWWVEGFAERPTYYASRLQWLAYPDEIRRATVANEVFELPFPTTGSLARAREAGLDLLVVPLASNRVDRDDLDRFLADHPEVVVFRNDDALILDPRAV